MKTWKITPHRAGAHVHVQVRYGDAGQRQLLGTLVMDEDTWDEFCVVMESGIESWDGGAA
jgi:hypothetical protein